MKLKKIMSLISALAVAASMAVSFETVSMAEKVDNKPEITVSVGVDEYDYYYVEYKLNMNGLGVVETKSGRDKFYSGIGVALVSMKINNVSSDDVYESIFVENSNTFGFTPNLSNNSLQFGNTGVLAVSGLYGLAPAPIAEGGLSIAKISTNYEAGTIAEEELIEKFSDFGFTSIKTATIPESSKASDLIGNENITTYSVADDGYTKHIDADFALITPETPAAPVGPQPGDIKTPATVISGNKKYSEVYDSNLNARVVFEENIGAQTVTADSVLKAKYLNDTHVANIYELLGISGEGSVEFTSFTVKMILPAGTAVTDDFSFVIQ